MLFNLGKQLRKNTQALVFINISLFLSLSCDFFIRFPKLRKPYGIILFGFGISILGFAISGRRILTNAHVVGDHSYLQVRKHGSPTKYKAEVKAFG